MSALLHWRIYSKSCFGQHKWIKSSNMALGHENAEILHFFCALVFFNNCLLHCILSNIGIEHSLISSYPTSNSRKMIQIKGYCFKQGGRKQSNISIGARHQWPLITCHYMSNLFSSVLPSNSLISVSDPYRAFGGDDTPVKKTLVLVVP